MTVPADPVVPVWMVVLPFGAVSVNVTFAPEAGDPPLRTVAVMGTALRRAKLEAGTERLAVSAGELMTVMLAVPDPTYELLDALASAK